MSRIGQWFDETLGPGATNSTGRHLVIGALMLIVVTALALAIWGAWGSRKYPGERRQAHFWCEQTAKEYVFDPDDIPGGESEDMARSMGTRIKNPDTGQRTLVPMDQCPKCEKYFVPESLKAQPAGRPPADSVAPRSVCPHCGTDVIKWYEQRHGKD